MTFTVYRPADLTAPYIGGLSPVTREGGRTRVGARGPWALTPRGPVQVQSYMEHHCSNSTDRRILLMFLDICSELSKLCQHFEALHAGTPVTNNLLEKCKTLVSQSNDLSSLRAK